MKQDMIMAAHGRFALLLSSRHIPKASQGGKNVDEDKVAQWLRDQEKEGEREKR